MKVTLEQLKKMLSTYRLKALRAQPIEDGYIVETSRGKKIVSIWQSPELLKWSNTWREQLFTEGYEAVERFLVNSNNKKYIRFQNKYFVLTDCPESVLPNIKDEGECKDLGMAYADYHCAVGRINAVVNTSAEPFNDNIFTEGSTVIKQIMKAIESKQEPTLVDEVIYANLPLLYKRFRRAYQLCEGIKEAIPYFPLSTESFRLEQLVKAEKGWKIRGGYNKGLVPLHQDTTQLIREIYEKSEWNLPSVLSFLEGYEKKRRLADNELVYILVQLAVPREVWKYFSNYLNQKEWSEADINRLAEAIHVQRHWDELVTQIGRYIDQRSPLSA